MYIRTPKNEVTLGELASVWLAEVKLYAKESTCAQYYRAAEVYIKPYFGEMRIAKIGAEELLAFSEFLVAEGGRGGAPLAAKTASDILCVLKSILKYGRRNGYPCAAPEEIKYPRRAAKNVSVIPREKLKIIEKELFNSEDAASLGIIFTLYTGVRIGELCGMRWGDIDFAAKTVTVRRTVERIANLSGGGGKTKVIVSEPKTACSHREIPLPDFLVKKLEKAALPSDFYIITGTRAHTEPHGYYVRYKKFMRKLGMEGYTFHALRHTFATRCVELGFDTKSLSEILGHANVSTTLAIYVHPTLEQKRAQMERLSPLF